MDLATVLASGVVAALVSGLVSVRNNERKIIIENITQERTKWREKIREKNLQIREAFKDDRARLGMIGAGLQLLLNPLDPLDRDIQSEVKLLCQKEATEEDAERFSLKLSLLLKHDWERAKQEANASVFRKRAKAERISYEQYCKMLTGSGDRATTETPQD